MTDDHEDQRVIGYLRQRADVVVPREAGHWAVAPAEPNRRSVSRFGAFGGLAVSAVAIAIVVVGVYLVSFTTNLPVAPPKPSNAAFASATPPPSGAPSQLPVIGAPFPASVFGMPVLSIARASQLVADGQLDGRDVAVAGWFFQEFPSCPAPNGYVGPLEGFCRIVAFADTRDGAQTCSSTGGCQLGDKPMAPWLMSDTLGQLDYNSQGPFPIVVIGHVDDPRQWQCLDRAKCSRAFVADRLAWASGNVVAPTANAFDSRTGQNLQPALSLDDVAAAIGSDNQVLSAVATDADGVRSFDPRWNRTGQNVLWVVRSVPTTGGSGADATRAVTVSLIDDSTGQVIDSHPLALGSDYNPARLWLTTIVHNPDPNYDNAIDASDRVTTATGVAVLDGSVGGTTRGGGGIIEIGPDLPLLIDPGAYSLTARLSPHDAGSVVAPIPACTTQQSLRAGDDVELSAVFPPSGNCTWSNQEKPSFGFP